MVNRFSHITHLSKQVLLQEKRRGSSTSSGVAYFFASSARFSSVDKKKGKQIWLNHYFVCWNEFIQFQQSREYPRNGLSYTVPLCFLYRIFQAVMELLFWVRTAIFWTMRREMNLSEIITFLIDFYHVCAERVLLP